VISTIFSKTAGNSLPVSLDFDALLVQNDHDPHQTDGAVQVT
jgi:hypothetical protein